MTPARTPSLAGVWGAAGWRSPPPAAAARRTARNRRRLLTAVPHSRPPLLHRWYIADDRGMVCPREAFDYATGCCSGGERHVCASCQQGDKCCAQFEHCVSCCLSPENEPEKHMNSIYRGRNK